MVEGRRRCRRSRQRRIGDRQLPSGRPRRRRRREQRRKRRPEPDEQLWPGRLHGRAGYEHLHDFGWWRLRGDQRHVGFGGRDRGRRGAHEGELSRRQQRRHRGAARR